jgi:hypothetical protein
MAGESHAPQGFPSHRRIDVRIVSFFAASPYLRSSCLVSPRSGLARKAAPARIGTVDCKDTSRCEKCVDLSSDSSYIVLARGYRSL